MCIKQSTRAKWIQYLHQACFSPTVSTWWKAIDNDQFIGWPGLSSKAVIKYLPESTSTAKGHMARTRQGIQSTIRPKQTNKKKVITPIDQTSTTPIQKVKAMASSIKNKTSIKQLINNSSKMDAIPLPPKNRSRLGSLMRMQGIRLWDRTAIWHKWEDRH